MKSSERHTNETLKRRFVYPKLKRRSRPKDEGQRKLQNARPPIQIPNLDGPSFFTYDIPKNPPMMTRFPAFTFRPKTQADRDGGQQKAWGKEWFAHNNVWLQKADFDPRLNWPSPTDYNMPDGIGKSSQCHPRSSSHTFSGRKEFTLVPKGVADEPGPGSYSPETGRDRLLSRPRVISIRKGYREGHYLWGPKESVPGPGSYNPNDNLKKATPSFSFSNTPRRLNYSARYTL